MSKLQNKLFAKLKRVEEIGQKIQLDVRDFEEDLTSLVDYSLVQARKLRSQLMTNAKDFEETFLEVGGTLDSIVNVFVLIINSVGARFLSEDQKNKVSYQKSCFDNCGLKNFSLY